MAQTRQIGQSVAIVVLGAFNPSIFQPSWFVQEELVRSEEGESVELEIIHPEITIFNMEWFQFQANRDRLVIRSSRESHFEAVRDLASGVLDILRHTPTCAVGVNHDRVLDCGSRDAFDRLGWTLVPKDPWVSVLERPGMSLLHEQGARTDAYDGFIKVMIEPILDGGNNVSTKVNDHFAMSADNSPSSTNTIKTLLGSEWVTISERASHILDRMKGLVT